MNAKKIVKPISLTLLLSASVLTFSPTFSKYTINKNGIAWTIDFTTYRLLDTVHTITDKDANSGKLYGAEGAFRIPTAEELLNMTEDEYNGIINDIKILDASITGLPSYEEVSTDPNGEAYKQFIAAIDGNSVINDDRGGSEHKNPSAYEGYYYFSQSAFEKLVGEYSNFGDNPYAIKNISDIVFNVVNDSGEPLLLCFDIHYYSKKVNDAANSVSFALYNTTKRGENLTNSNDKVLKGEFPIKYTGGLLSGEWRKNVVKYTKTGIANVLGSRIGGGCQVNDDGEFYYPCLGEINPYDIKKDPILNLNTDQWSEIYGGAAIDKYVSGETSAESINTNYNLNDFVIPSTGELYTFNLSLFYGNNFGSNTGDGYAFLAGIEMYTIPITDEIQTQLNTDSSLG